MESWNCEATEKVLEEYLAGEAEQSSLAEAEDHASACEACAEKISRAKRLAALLEGSMNAMGAEVIRKTFHAGLEGVPGPEPSRRTSQRMAVRRRRYAYVAMAAAAALILIVLWIGYGSLLKIQKASPYELAKLQVNTMSKALARIRNPQMPDQDNQRFVAMLEIELARELSLSQRPRVEQGRFLDPWGRPYILKSLAPGGNFTVYSVGENGLDESCNGDDVTPSR